MQFKLLVPHTHPANQQLLDSGTIVGDNTAFPWVDAKGRAAPPSLGMAGLDEESQAHIDSHYDDEVRNDPMLPKHVDEDRMEHAISDIAMNRPNPNVSPIPKGGADAQQTRNETHTDPLRGAPKGALPSEPAKPPQGGATTRNPLDLGSSPKE